MSRFKFQLPHFGPRLAAELKTQKRSIVLGAICTAIASTLYASMIPFTKATTLQLETIYTYSNHHLPSAVPLQNRALHALSFYCLLFVALFVVRYWFARGQIYYFGEAANRLAADLRVRMFRKLLRLPVTYFNDRRSGAIQSVLTNDVNVYQNAVGVLKDSVEGPIKAVGALCWLFVLEWHLATIALVMIPLLVVIIERNSRRMRQAQTQAQEDLSEVSATTQEVLQGNRIVKAFGAEERTGTRYMSLVMRSLQSQMRLVSLSAALRPLVELIGASAFALLIFIGGQLFARVGSLSSSTIIAMAFAMDVINQGFKALSGLSNTMASVQAASDRIHDEILEVHEAHELQGTLSLPEPSGRIEFKNVSFTYPDGTRALNDVSFVIEPGHSLALVGTSGAGKSTIADLVLRFYDPTEGQILFDGTDIRELSVAWLRSQIGVVPQQTFLFAGSIEENVRLGAPGASAEDLRLALHQAHAEEFTDEMSNRAVAELGERGVRLSGGQMQRIAIARALVRKPTVLLLDEATSALDANSEKIVTDALHEVMQERTTLFIAHRLTTAARADRILVLSRGEVVEVGSHAELIEAKGTYAALFKAFSGGVL